jgi:hypothetical protein
MTRLIVGGSHKQFLRSAELKRVTFATSALLPYKLCLCFYRSDSLRVDRLRDAGSGFTRRAKPFGIRKLMSLPRRTKEQNFYSFGALFLGSEIFRHRSSATATPTWGPAIPLAFHLTRRSGLGQRDEIMVAQSSLRNQRGNQLFPGARE